VRRSLSMSSESMSLLPPNSTDFEASLEVPGFRVDAMAVDIGLLWDPETCPIGFLPWLAWALSVDEWDPVWSEDQKRGVVSASVEVHRHKGTLWSIRRSLAGAGYGAAEVVERFGWETYSGAFLHDGGISHSEPDHWAEYRIRLTRPITIEQAAQVREILEAVQPAHCRLKALDFTEALNIYDARILFDGQFTHGVA
jgi:phage tail P2-like protein